MSCCPPNVGRTLASLSGYVATADADGVHVHQYASGSFEAMTDHGPLRLRVSTAYPRDGRIEVEVLEAPAEAVAIRLRIPAWAAGAELVDGAESRAGLEPGYVETARVFEAGDRLVLTLPVAPAFLYPDDRIDDVRGTVAVQRGPEVFCVESVDLPAGADLDGLRVHPETPPADDGTGGVIVRRHDHATRRTAAGPTRPSTSSVRRRDRDHGAASARTTTGATADRRACAIWIPTGS